MMITTHGQIFEANIVKTLETPIKSCSGATAFARQQTFSRSF